MDRIELHDVEYGDCTVLVGRDQSVLMVDCGSVSQYVRRDQTDITQRFDAIFHRYTAASARYFLLTHYHRDHMNGFLRKLRQDPNYFDWVCLPALPYADGRCPILGIALYAHFFSAPQSDFAQVNTACLTIYDLLHNTVGAARICTLRAGDSFMFDRTVYEVLSPGADFAYDPALFDAAASLDAAMEQIPETAGFLRLKAEYLSAYAACQAALSPTGMDRDAALERLSAVWRELDALRGTLRLSPGVPERGSGIFSADPLPEHTLTKHFILSLKNGLTTKRNSLVALTPSHDINSIIESILNLPNCIL